MIGFVTWPPFCTIFSGVARPKLMVGPDYRGTKEVLEDLALHGCTRLSRSDRSIQQLLNLGGSGGMSPQENFENCML